nr:winged helix-turn-helix domain-containing protein [Micromonospora sp. M42]
MPTAEAPYRQIANELAAKIKSGELKPGDKLPSTRELAEAYGVHMNTASRALSLLHDRELITRRPGLINSTTPRWRHHPAPPRRSWSPHEHGVPRSLTAARSRADHRGAARDLGTGWPLGGLSCPGTCVNGKSR